MVKMVRNMVKEYFDSLAQLMKKNQSEPEWNYVESSVTKAQIEQLQEKYDVIFPEIYREFISAYAHHLKRLYGKLDNFLFEDDVEVVLEIPMQEYKQELDEITELFESHLNFLRCGYLPIGTFEDSGIIGLSLDTGEVLWIDFDEYYECESKEDIEERGIVVFKTFVDLLDCFFKKKVYVCPDED